MCRPVGQFFDAYMPYSGSEGLVTSEQNVVLLLVWSEPVTGLTPNSFSVSGPSVTGSIISGLKLLRGTTTYYHLTVNLPGNYYDGITVSMKVSLALVSHQHLSECVWVAVQMVHTCSVLHADTAMSGGMSPSRPREACCILHACCWWQGL